MLSYRAACSAWQIYCRRAGIEATIHQLRHTVGTELINEGMPMDLIRQRLGHANLSMVQRYGEMSYQTLKSYLNKREEKRS